jgi:hypothetical protein
MKTWHLFVSIVVILALVCSPGLAISKADLISQYKGQSSPTIRTPIPTPTPAPLTPYIYVVHPWFPAPPAPMSQADLDDLLARCDEFYSKPPSYAVVFA